MKAIVVPIYLTERPYMIDVHPMNELATYYKTINCRLIDVVTIYNNEHIAIDCIVDDEGLINYQELNHYWLRAYLYDKCNLPLFGITIITMTNLDTGDTIDLDLNKAKDVLKHMYGFTDYELENIHD